MSINQNLIKEGRLIVPDCPKKVTFGMQGSCNLSCPKCIVWGNNNSDARLLHDMPKGIMQIEDIVKIFDEVKSYRPTIAPGFWIEPIGTANFERFVVEACARDLPIHITTNGIQVNENMAEFLVDHVSLISVSIDAMTEDVLYQVRKTRLLQRINNAVHCLLEKRGKRKSPRITVSFTVEEANHNQKDEFLEYWVKYVDAIKINHEFSYKGDTGKIVLPKKRIPCREIYDAMNIDYDGTARLCCLDGMRQTNVGNVLTDGVLGVWNGELLSKIRNIHENELYDEFPFCKNCSLWSYFNVFEEKLENNLLLRSSLENQVVFYNRLDKLDTWIEENKRKDLYLHE